MADGNILDRLDDLVAPAIEACSRGIRLSKITAKLKDSIDVTPLQGSQRYVKLKLESLNEEQIRDSKLPLWQVNNHA